MEILFRTRKMQRACSSDRQMVRTWGETAARKLKQRLAELQAAATLQDIRHLPAARCHELTQDRKGQLAVDLMHPFRLILEPADDPVPARADGSLDWARVTRIAILEVTDYH